MYSAEIGNISGYDSANNMHGPLGIVNAFRAKIRFEDFNAYHSVNGGDGERTISLFLGDPTQDIGDILITDAFFVYNGPSSAATTTVEFKAVPDVGAYITLISSAGDTWKITAAATDDETGSVDYETEVVSFYKGTSAAEAAENFVNALIAADIGIRGSDSVGVVSLNQAHTGAEGNTAVAESAVQAASLSFAFDAAGTVNSQIKLTDEAGVIRTYTFKSSVTSGTVDGTVDGQPNIVVDIGSDEADAASELKTAVEHSNGHNGSIVTTANVDGDGNVVLTQNVAGSDGNTTVTLDQTSGVDFTASVDSEGVPATFTGGAGAFTDFTEGTPAAFTGGKYSSFEASGMSDFVWTIGNAQNRLGGGTGGRR